MIHAYPSNQNNPSSGSTIAKNSSEETTKQELRKPYPRPEITEEEQKLFTRTYQILGYYSIIAFKFLNEILDKCPNLKDADKKRLMFGVTPEPMTESKTTQSYRRLFYDDDYVDEADDDARRIRRSAPLFHKMYGIQPSKLEAELEKTDWDVRDTYILLDTTNDFFKVLEQAVDRGLAVECPQIAEIDIADYYKRKLATKFLTNSDQDRALMKTFFDKDEGVKKNSRRANPYGPTLNDDPEDTYMDDCNCGGRH